HPSFLATETCVPQHSTLLALTDVYPDKHESLRYRPQMLPGVSTAWLERSAQGRDIRCANGSVFPSCCWSRGARRLLTSPLRVIASARTASSCRRPGGTT